MAKKNAKRAKASKVISKEIRKGTPKKKAVAIGLSAASLARKQKKKGK